LQREKSDLFKKKNQNKTKIKFQNSKKSRFTKQPQLSSSAQKGHKYSLTNIIQTTLFNIMDK